MLINRTIKVDRHYYTAAALRDDCCRSSASMLKRNSLVKEVLMEGHSHMTNVAPVFSPQRCDGEMILSSHGDKSFPLLRSLDDAALGMLDRTKCTADVAEEG